MSPDDYERLYDEAREEPAFCNGTEAEDWISANCAVCVHDRPARLGDDTRGCPLILISLMDRRPVQWLDGPRDAEGRYSMARQYTCIEFRHEDDEDPEPRPTPDPPGQGVLMPREPYTGVRMLTALPEGVSAP
ncbi:hypothetical protein [Streptomyces aidingensis]|uniref:Uncharacterized protein n=1 Tax=Streptomyces aidingensis TaxID=910347 RepID=A0A1I1PST4_9ACTN|nr:hypothetical protein [Streptomyces aidingensis]SFD12906.1 hypothetical protein SAMN05421773_11031 [Streptomyces aidingensis]